MGRKSGKIQGAYKNQITLSTGVVLKVQAVASWNYTDLVSQVERPVPPIMVIDGDRKIENPEDPEYKKAMRKFEVEISDKMNNYSIVYGTEIVSVPETVEKVESESWRSKLKWRGKAIGDDPVELYLNWIKYVAAPKRSDVMNILLGVGRLSGVRESDVETAASNFRRPDTGDAGKAVQGKDGD